MEKYTKEEIMMFFTWMKTDLTLQQLMLGDMEEHFTTWLKIRVVKTFEVKIDNYTILVTPKVETITELTEDEIDHIWDRLEDEETEGSLWSNDEDSDDDVILLSTWKLI